LAAAGDEYQLVQLPSEQGGCCPEEMAGAEPAYNG